MVDIWKTTPFMALLILAGLQMMPGDIYEAAKIDGVHPIKVFFKVTLPLVRPALMVAVIFRMLDALRIFDLIYVLTPNNAQTKTMSVFARENLFDFDKFAYGSAASTMLFLIMTRHHRRLHHRRQGQLRGRPLMLWHVTKRVAFYLLVVGIVFVSIFPFYYAILTTFKSGTALFRDQLLADELLAGQLHRGADDGQLPPQPRQLAAGRLAWWSRSRCCWP